MPKSLRVHLETEQDDAKAARPTLARLLRRALATEPKKETESEFGDTSQSHDSRTDIDEGVD